MSAAGTGIGSICDTNEETLRKALLTSKKLFWLEKSDLPEIEIQRLWQLRWNWLTSRLPGTFEKHCSERTDEHERPGTRELFSYNGINPTHSDTRLSTIFYAGGMETPRIVEVTQDDQVIRQKAEIPLTTRRLSQREATFCSLCSDHPKGFHGQHELRRHIQLFHTTYRKRQVWICKDSPNSQIQPTIPLAHCKPCRSQKPYGAKYNAAAHLRRAHFCHSKTERGAYGKVSKRRVAVRGGLDPTMDELQNWMVVREEIDNGGNVKLQENSRSAVGPKRKDMIIDEVPLRTPSIQSNGSTRSMPESVDSGIGLSHRFEEPTGRHVNYENLFGAGALPEHRTLYDRVQGFALDEIGGSTTIHDFESTFHSSRPGGNYNDQRGFSILPETTLPAQHPWNGRRPSYARQSNPFNHVEVRDPQAVLNSDLQHGHVFREQKFVSENAPQGNSGLALASDAGVRSYGEISTRGDQRMSFMPVMTPLRFELAQRQSQPGENTPQSESEISSPQACSLPGVLITQEAVDAKKEKRPQSPSATPESEGENSFVEGWEDHQSPRALAVENENLFTNICDILSRQLTDTYICGLHNDQGNVQLRVPRHNSCARSDSSTAASQKSKDTSVVSETTAPTTEPPLSKKRDSEHGEDDDQSRDRKRKGPRRNCSKAEISDGRLLACPYFKHDPTRYSERNVLEQTYRGCSSCVLRDISRLKQHLYRVHRRPDHYCGRCSEDFVSQDALDAHTRAETRCDAADPRYPEKMTSNQLTCIKRKKPGRDAHDTWYIIFKILFPDASLPTSPFAECVPTDAIASFIVHAERQGPALLSGLISTDLQNLRFYRQHDRQIIEEAMERAFPQVIRELNRQFNPFSSPSDVRSSQPALASSAALDEIDHPAAPHDAALRSTLNTTSALFDSGQPAPPQTPQVYSVPGLDFQPHPDSSAFQDLSAAQVVPEWSLAPFRYTSADNEAFLAQSESQPRHADPQSDFWGTPYPSYYDDAHNAGDNIYQSNQ